MSLTGSRDRLLGAVVDLLWAQWTELGVGGTKGTSSSIVDPEALLAATSLFGRYEPRLFDEVLDWLAAHSDLLDVTRLRRASNIHRLGDKRLLAVLVDFMRERSSSDKWSGAADRALAGEETEPYAPQPLFRTPDGGALPTPGTPDAFFASHGFERPDLTLRGLSVPPDPRRPTLARLRLRALTGQGVRAEVLLYLSTHDHAHGRLVAERTAFSQRQVAEYLAGLARAGLAESWEDGRRLEYRLLAPLAAMGADAASYVDWTGAFGVIAELWTILTGAALEPDAYRASTVLRSGLGGVRKYLPVEGFGLGLPEPERYPGETLNEHAIEFATVAAERIRAFAG
jgi:hypothetical protein